MLKKNDMWYYKEIMKYWAECAYSNTKKDFAINDLLENYVSDCGITMDMLNGEIELTVLNMTASQKRKLYKKMLESGIRER